jgi:hypothetical protein
MQDDTTSRVKNAGSLKVIAMYVFGSAERTFEDLSNVRIVVRACTRDLKPNLSWILGIARCVQ